MKKRIANVLRLIESLANRRLNEINSASSILAVDVLSSVGAKNGRSASPSSFDAKSLYMSTFSLIIREEDGNSDLPLESTPVEAPRTVEPLQ